MMRLRRASGLALLVATLVLGLPRPSSAQWYVAGYLGGNYTRPSTITVDQPSEQTALTADGVEFSSEPLRSPIYYGVRVGRLFGSTARVGLELEFMHLKAFARTAEARTISGAYLGEPIDASAPQSLDRYVQRFAMSHGLNVLVVNAVSRTPIGGGATALVIRGGVGPAIPHAETTIGGRALDQYQYGGLATHLAVGIDTRLTRRLSAVAEYKLTRARPTLDVVNGTGRVTALSHHVAVGLAFGLPR
jgi:hypothetical protein